MLTRLKLSVSSYSKTTLSIIFISYVINVASHSVNYTVHDIFQAR